MRGALLKRVVRGGSWFSYARFCRLAFRFASHPDFRVHRVGFRLVVGVQRCG